MITNFYGGIEEEPEESIGVAMGCGCSCDCSKQEDMTNAETTCIIDLTCQPYPLFIMPRPFPG